MLFTDLGFDHPYADQLLFAFASLPGNLVSVFFIEAIGRVRLLSSGMLLAGCCSLGFALFPKNQGAVVLFTALYNAFATAGWNALDCLSAEAFPTQVRGVAIGSFSSFGRIAAICAQYAFGYWETSVTTVLWLTSAIMICGAVLGFLLPS